MSKRLFDIEGQIITKATVSGDGLMIEVRKGHGTLYLHCEHFDESWGKDAIEQEPLIFELGDDDSE